MIFFSHLCTKLYSVPALKRITIQHGQHSALSLEETDCNFISLNKSVLGKEIRNFNAAAFAKRKKSSLAYSYQKS